MTLLTASNISVAMHGVKILDDIGLTIDCGKVVAVIGPNGAGKTSLVKAITGDLPLSGGQVAFNGKALDSYPLEERARQLAMLAQQSELNFPFAVADVVRLGRTPHASGLQVDNRIVAETLQAVDMGEHAGKLYTWLSGGEKQRVQLARVLAQVWRAEDAEVRLLVLDEPTASLDVAHTQQLMRVLREMASDGVGVIMNVHDFNIAARYADHIVVLQDGRLEVEGAPVEVITESMMRRIFKVETRILPNPDNGRPMVFIND